MTISSMSNQTVEEVDALEKQAHANGKKLMVEVIADDSGKFCGNGLRFDTAKEAIAYGEDLSSRWLLVREFRVQVDNAVV